MAAVATDSDQKVDTEIDQEDARLYTRETGPVQADPGTMPSRRLSNRSIRYG